MNRTRNWSQQGASRRSLGAAVAAGAVSGAAFAMVGCGPENNATKTAESATISFMNRGGREAFVVHDKVIAAFVEKAPNIRVNVEPVIEGTWIAKLTTAIAAGTPPDTVMCAFGDFLPYCKRGDLLELEAFLAKDKEVKTADWFPLALDSMKYKGKLYNMPYNGGTYALFYNRELFDKAKVKYPDDTWTWDRYVEAAGQLATDVKGISAVGAGYDGNNVAVYGADNVQNEPSWIYWVWANGADIYTANNREVNFRDAKVLDAIQAIADLHRRRLWASALVKDTATIGFRSANVAMTTWGHWNVARVRTDPFKWDVAPMPKTKDGRRIALGWYSGNGMVRGTKHPDAAWQLLKFFGGAPGQRILGIEGLTLPAVRRVAESDEIMKSTPPENQRAFLTEIDKARIRFNWNITEIQDWNEAINPELNKIWLGESKAKDVLPALVPRLNEVLSRN